MYSKYYMLYVDWLRYGYSHTYIAMSDGLVQSYEDNCFIVAISNSINYNYNMNAPLKTKRTNNIYM